MVALLWLNFGQLLIRQTSNPQIILRIKSSQAIGIFSINTRMAFHAKQMELKNTKRPGPVQKSLIHSTNNLCFGAPRPAAKSAITPGWAFRRTDGPTSLLIKRRFSQISIIFESVAGGKTLPRPHNTYFSSKKSSLLRII